MNSAPNRAATEVLPELDTDVLTRLLPPWNVILHNDDHNSMDHVIASLLASVQSLTPERAVEIMFTAHEHGQAVVVSCVKEAAEHYRDRLESRGLTATIEPA